MTQLKKVSDTPPFQREERYIVIKRKDADKHLSFDDLVLLDTLQLATQAGRSSDGKTPLVCLVIESDWPEYEPTWAAIKKRMEGNPPTSQPAKGTEEPMVEQFKTEFIKELKRSLLEAEAERDSLRQSLAVVERERDSLKTELDGTLLSLKTTHEQIDRPLTKAIVDAATTNGIEFVGRSPKQIVEALRAELAALKATTARDTERLCTDANVEIAAKAIWAQHMNKLDRADQTPWEEAAPLGRGITLAYAKNALLAIDAAMEGKT